jgi:phosphohistidine phosphatase
MKREIILLRHAHADNADSAANDSERGLSARGITEARDAGHWLRSHAALPAKVLCSPARRALQTLDEALGDVERQLEQRIYEATAGELASLIDEYSDTPQLMLVGHNPGFETLVALLVTGQSGDFRGVPPGGVAWLEIDGLAEPGAGKLKAFWSP